MRGTVAETKSMGATGLLELAVLPPTTRSANSRAILEPRLTQDDTTDLWVKSARRTDDPLPRVETHDPGSSRPPGRRQVSHSSPRGLRIPSVSDRCAEN